MQQRQCTLHCAGTQHIRSYGGKRSKILFAFLNSPISPADLPHSLATSTNPAVVQSQPFQLAHIASYSICTHLRHFIAVVSLPSPIQIWIVEIEVSEKIVGGGSELSVGSLW